MTAPLRPTVRAHAALTVASVVVLGVANTMLERSYAASKFPVSYAEGQTSFDATAIKGYYQTMIDADTLGVYWRTQLIDFGFIAAVICAGVLLATLVARANRNRWTRALAMTAAVLIPLGAGFDVLENLTSFAMLARPTTFASWLAIPYSTFAVIKFALLATGMTATLVAAIGIVLPRRR